MISFNVQKAVFELFNKIIADYGDMEVENIEALRQGLYFDTKLIDSRIYEYIIQTKGVDIFKLNQTLHKSFSVYDKDKYILIMQQILHYISTYEMGLNEEMYVPNEVLDPEIKEGSLPIAVIKTITIEELETAINDIIKSSMALKTNHIVDIFTIISGFQFNVDINACKNKELKLKLYDHYHTFPEDPDEFMKYVCYKATNNTLIVKNNDLFSILKISKVSSFIHAYVNKYGEKKLAECFYRWKNQFLAIKRDCPTVINKISRLAKKYHTTMPKHILDHITEYSPDIVIKELEKVSIYKKIQIINLIQYRALNNDISLYQIRNGKSFIKSGQVKGINLKILNYLINNLVHHLSKKVNGKYIHYPEFIDYALPSSQKNMLGIIPFGTEINLGKKCLLGIHWYNVDNHQVDLDFSLQSESRKLGWNGYWNDHDMWFSGDMTNAPLPNGASEFYYIENQTQDFYTIHVNDYTCEGNVPYDLILQKNGGDRQKNYVIKHSEELVKIPCVMTRYQQDIGLLQTGENKKVYIANISLSNGNVSKRSDLYQMLLDYYQCKFESMIRFKEILELSGAIFEKPEDKEWDYDLTPQNLSPSTFIDLLGE